MLSSIPTPRIASRKIKSQTSLVLAGLYTGILEIFDLYPIVVQRINDSLPIQTAFFQQNLFFIKKIFLGFSCFKRKNFLALA